MAEENTEPAGKIAEAKTEPAGKPGKSASPGTKTVLGMNIWILISVIVILAVAVAALVALSGAPGKPEVAPVNKPITGNTGVSTDNKVPLLQLTEGMPEAISSIKQMTVTGGMDLKMFMTGQGDVNATGSLEMEYDVENERAHMLMEATGSAQGYSNKTTQVVEAYVADGMVYSKTTSIVDGQEEINPYMGNGWIKQPATESLAMPDAENVTILLKGFKGEVVGTETINGEKTRKILTSPDLRALMDQDIFKNAGLSQVDIDSMITMFEDSLKRFDVYVWVSDETSLPVKLDGDIALDVDLSGLYGGIMGGSIKADISANADFDYTTPVSITVPEEALNATDLYSAVDLGTYRTDNSTWINGSASV